MKKILILLAVVAVVFSCKNKLDSDDKNITEISGKIENAGNMRVLVIYNNITDSIEMNDQGEFVAKINITEPMYVYVSSENFYATTYVFPGTKTNFTANIDDFHNTLKFSGDNADINNYLASFGRLDLEYDLLSGEIIIAPEFETFRLVLVELQEEVAVELNNLAKKNEEKYADFVKLENDRLKLYYIQMLIQYYLINDSQDPNINIEIEKIASTTDFNNKGLLYTNDFIQCFKNYINVVKMADGDFKTVQEYAQAYFSEIDKILVETEALEELYYVSLKEFINIYGPESVRDIFAKYKDLSTNKEHLKELEDMFAEFDKLASGKPSVEWTFTDINGKNISSSDFIGKYVYIDVWASWCGPCKAEIPYLETLKKKLAGKNIEFVSISVDEDIEDWKNSLKKESATGIQLYAGGWENALCKHFKINGIPRFILLDRDGNIIKSDADRPSGDIETEINALDGI
jgi:thiol-disulfide isomerase/thioredoxin